jgi:hypothetical protein
VSRLAYRILVREPEGRAARVRPRYKLEVKVKYTFEQAMKAQRGRRHIALLFL